VGRFKDSTIVKGVVLYEHNPGPISNLIVWWPQRCQHENVWCRYELMRACTIWY
jgi:hypothetical protein